MKKKKKKKLDVIISGWNNGRRLRLEHSFLLLVMWGSQKQNKEKIQIVKHK